MGSRSFLLTWLVCLCLSLSAVAQQPVATEAAGGDEAIHTELRAMREALTKAVEDGDVDAQLAHVHDNVVVTWQTNEVCRGPAGLKKFLSEIDNGENRVFQGYKVPPTTDEPTILFGGDVGIAFGKSTPHYKMLGMEFDLENRWTATLVKEGEAWKLASYHVSGNLLDNPVLDIAKRSVYWAGGIGVVAGIAVGSLFTWLMKRRPAPGA